MLLNIHYHKHEIGIHPGYNTYQDSGAFASSVDKLKQVMIEEGIEQPILVEGQHYLRWKTPTTAQIYEKNGLSYDTTLGYADHPGFRCGTCYEYPFFDALEQRQLNIRERPLILMECSVIEKGYLGLGHSQEAVKMMQKLKKLANKLEYLRYSGITQI